MRTTLVVSTRRFNRRIFLQATAVTPLIASAGQHTLANSPPLHQQRFFFTSQGKTAMMNADGSGLRYLSFDVPNQVTSNKTLVAKQDGHLYFAPRWSPDVEWLIFQDCQSRKHPGHDWADMVLSRPDGSDQRLLTEGQPLWFAATYGSPKTRGGGSNVPIWSRDGTILFSRGLPNSKPAWEYQAERVDVDHFNRDYKPDLAQGGTEICRMNPKTGVVQRITDSEPPVWDFRQVESSDGQHILFCRAKTGDAPALWMMDSKGKHQRILTQGVDGLGADHPRWIPKKKQE